jgi:hypothetical protein
MCPKDPELSRTVLPIAHAQSSTIDLSSRPHQRIVTFSTPVERSMNQKRSNEDGATAAID